MTFNNKRIERPIINTFSVKRKSGIYLNANRDRQERVDGAQYPSWYVYIYKYGDQWPSADIVPRSGQSRMPSRLHKQYIPVCNCLRNVSHQTQMDYKKKTRVYTIASTRSCGNISCLLHNIYTRTKLQRQ